MSWQFWVVFVVAAMLRLVAIQRSPFGSDDALLFLEAARAAHSHLLPGTGIFSSLLALNMPFYIWLLLPFAYHPMGMEMLTAITNVLAVAGLYIFADRYFGRWAAFLGALLYATACYATWMSEFVWQQTLMLPFIIGIFISLYLGAVERKRHWLIPHALLLAALIQLHPVAASLLPLSLIGLILGWRAVSALDVIVVEVGIAALYAPTILFELASGGYDLRPYQAYLSRPSHQDGQVFGALGLALGPRPYDYLGTDTLYAHIAGSFGWLVPVVFTLWALGTLWVAGTLARPLARAVLRRWRRARRSGDTSIDPSALARNRAGWIARLLLLPWPITLILAALRHSAPIYDHYVFVVIPIIYVTIGLFLGELPFWIGRIAGSLLSASQLVLTGAFIIVLVTGQAPAASWGGIPIPAFTHALDVTQSAAREQHAKQVFIASDPTDPYLGLYWAERQNDLAPGGRTRWTSYVAGDCALQPAPASGSGLLLATDTSGLAYQELLLQPGTATLQTIAMARGETFPLHAIAPNPSNPASTVIATFNGELRLDSASVVSADSSLPRRLMTHWTVLASTPPGPAVAQYHVRFTFVDPTGTRVSVPASCEPGDWIAGEGILFVVPLPAVIGAERASWRLDIAVFRDTHTWYRPQIGTLTLETAKELTLDYVLLPIGTHLGPGIARPGAGAVRLETVTLPSAQLSP